MAYINVSFLGKEYQISDYLPTLVPILQTFDSYQEKLLGLLVDQMKNNKYTGGADEDFIYWEKPIRSIAKNIILMAADNEIYDLTENELVDKNPGYNQLNTICSNTIKNIAQSYVDSIQNLLDESERAYSAAASNITGSGVSIWTNSLANAMWYNFLEGRVLTKQAKEADKQYSEEMRKISARNTQNQEANETRIRTEYYYPGCNEAINQIIASMLNTYLTTLDKNKVLNCKEISQYNLTESVEIMKNLDIIPQKAGVLAKAFEKCPYNAAIYEQALLLKIFDDDSIQTIKYLGLEDGFTALLNNYIGNIHEITDLANIERKQYYVHLHALCQGISDNEYRKTLTSSICTKVKDKYAFLYKIITDDYVCLQYSETNKNSKNLDILLENEVRNIISKQNLEYLINKCSQTSILADITPNEIHDEQNKDKIDEYYIEKLKEIVIPRVSEILDHNEKERIHKEIIREQERRQQEEIKKQKEKKETIIFSIIGLSVLCVIIVLVVVFYVIPAKKRQNLIEKAAEYKNNHQFDEAISLYSELGDDYNDDILSCKYEKAENLFSNNKYSEAAEIYRSISDYSNSSDKLKECQYMQAIEMEESGDKQNAAKLYFTLKDYKDSRDRYIKTSINAGYVSFRKKEEYSRKNDESTQYSTSQRAYRFITANFTDNEKIGAYMICIEEGREKMFGYIDLSKNNYQTVGPSIIDIDSEMYIFSNKTDYDNKDYEKAIIHKSIECIESDDSEITNLRNGITVTAGFCTYDSDENNLIIKDTWAWTYEEGGYYGYKVHGKPFINVSGLNDDEQISLYTLLVLESSPYIYCDEGETVFSINSNCVINDFSPSWKKFVVDNPLACDATIYVFADYNSYIDHNIDNAIASGSITYEE